MPLSMSDWRFWFSFLVFIPLLRSCQMDNLSENGPLSVLPSRHLHSCLWNGAHIWSEQSKARLAGVISASRSKCAWSPGSHDAARDCWARSARGQRRAPALIHPHSCACTHLHSAYVSPAPFWKSFCSLFVLTHRWSPLTSIYLKIDNRHCYHSLY